MTLVLPYCTTIDFIKVGTPRTTFSFFRVKWYFVTKIVLSCSEKKKSSGREKLLKFKAEGREFAKVLRSLEQFIQTVKGQYKNGMLF